MLLLFHFFFNKFNLNSIKPLNIFIQEIDEDFNINNKNDRNILISLISEFLEGQDSFEKEIETLEEKINERKKVKLQETFSKAELHNIWKNLPPIEKKKFYKPLNNTFLHFMYTCRLNKFREHLTTVYESIFAKYPQYKTYLIETIENIDDYLKGDTTQYEWNKIIYLDPFNKDKPLLGINSQYSGPDNVGKILQYFRRKFIFDKKKKYESKLKKAILEEKQIFNIIHSKLKEILRVRDIKDFLGLTIDEIYKKLNNAIRVNTPNRSFIVYLDSNNEAKYDDKIDIDTIRKLLNNIGLPENIEIESFTRIKHNFTRASDDILEFLFTDNIENINDIFTYEVKNPGNLASYLRKKHIHNLYLIQVEEEKNTITRAVLEYLYLSDKKNRVDTKDIEQVITHELSNITDYLSKKSLIGVLDNLYKNNDLEKIVPDNCFNNITVNDINFNITTYVDFVLDRDRLLGKLVNRVSSKDVKSAQTWNFKYNQKINALENIEKYEEEENILGPRDKNTIRLFNLDKKENISPMDSFMNMDESNTLLSLKQGNAYKLHDENIDYTIKNKTVETDIIFSSKPGEFEPFLLNPTNNIITTVDYRKFPTILHAVCYLWVTRDLGYNSKRTEAYKLLIKPKWNELFNELGIFDDVDNIPFDKFKITLNNKGFEEISEFIEKKLNNSNSVILIDNDTRMTSLIFLRYELFTYLLESNEDPFISWKESYQILINIMDVEMFKKIDKLLKKAYTIKFSDPTMRKLLLRTGNTFLYYGDKNDPVLGTGFNNNGRNLAGFALMRHRDELKEKYSHLIMELSNDIVTALAEFFNKKLEIFSNLINIIKNHVKDNNLTFKITLGFLTLYKINCIKEEIVPAELTGLLVNNIDSICKKNKYSKKIKNLLWSYVKLMFAQSYNNLYNTVKVKENDSCLFNPYLKIVTKQSKDNASKLLNKFINCLLDIFKSEGKINIDKLVTDIVNDNNGRTKYIGDLKIINLTQEEKSDIINGVVNYYDLI